MFKKIIIASLILLSVSSLNAQNLSNKLSCPSYTFSRDLAQGSTGADVRLLQEILNADYRTQIAPSGNIGSPGRETANFQVATRESVKRFQALFIELIGIANGKVGPKTRIVLNSVCQGPYFTNGTGGVYDGIPTTATNTDKTAPIVNLTSPNISYLGESYRVYVYASEPVKYPTADSFIVDGGAILSDIRKEGPSTYKVLVTPTQTATHTIKIQMEADAIVDLAGNKSTYASNQVSTLISPAPAGPDTTSPSITLEVPIYITVGQSYRLNIISNEAISTPSVADFVTTGNITLSDIQKTDDKNYSALVSSTNTGEYSATVQMPEGKVSDKIGNKNTASNILNIRVLPNLDSILQTPTTPTPTTTTPTTTTNPYDYSSYNPGSGSDSGQGMDPLQLLMGALSGISALKGLLDIGQSVGSLAGAGVPAGGVAGGGAISAPSPCACMPLRKTMLFTPLGLGAPGYYFSDLNPTALPGCYVTGFTLPIPASPVNMCGSQIIPKTVPKKGSPYCPPGISYEIPTNPGFCCVGPSLNVAGQPVIGTFPPSPVLRGCGGV